MRSAFESADAMTDAAQPCSNGRVAAVGVALVLCSHFVLAMDCARFHSPAYDEPAHLASGISDWTLNDFRLLPDQGCFPQRWAAAAALLGGSVRFPSRQQAAWQQSDVWTIAKQLLYDSGNNAQRLITSGRAAVALLSVALCLVVFCWSRSVWGRGGAWISLLCAAFCPNLIAHGHLITSDLCAALFFTASVWQIWRNLTVVTIGRTLLGGLLVSGLFLSKYSAPLVMVMALVMVVCRLLSRAPLTVDLPGWRRTQISSIASQVAVILSIGLVYGAITCAMIWTAYNWRYSTFAAEDKTANFAWAGTLDKATESLGITGKIVRALVAQRILPEPFLYGTAYTAGHMTRPAFWNGRFSKTGWPGYFPYCWLVKTPLPTLGLLALALVAGWCGWRRGAQPTRKSILSSELVPAVVLLAVYWLVAVTSTLNIGLRHILPTYPAMFVVIGGVSLLGGLRIVRLLTVCLLSWLVSDCVAYYPNYIAYFNSTIPLKQAYRHLVDSNLDWGQDLPQLKAWLDKFPSQHNSRLPVFIAYFGRSVEPAAYGIEATDLRATAARLIDLKPGLYCLSATNLQFLRDVPELARPGAIEQIYREVHPVLEPYRSSSPEQLERAAQTNETLLYAITATNWVQSAQLAAYLWNREPLANIGGSILVYQLNRSELEAALPGR